MSGHDPMDLEADETEQKKALGARKLARQVELEDLVWLMDNKRGRRIVWRLLERAHVLGMSIVFGQPDRSAFNEGARNVGNWFLGEADTASPEGTEAMRRENRKAAK